MKRRCFKCGAEWEIKGPIGFREECPECAAFMHTCVTCVRYDARNRLCTIPTTEPVRDVHEQNFCEEFEYGQPNGTAAKGASPRAGAAPGLQAKASDKPVSAEDARRKFEDLFRDPPK